MTIADRFSLKDRVALVTGGAGLYGTAIVEALAEAGAATLIGDLIDTSDLQPLIDRHRGLGREVEALQFDQADESSVLDLRDEIVARHGRIDVLVNNAVARTMPNGYQDAAESFARSMQINATGLFMITRAIGDVMAGQEKGSIINIASIQGMVGPDPAIYKNTSLHGFYPDYFFHKGGMLNFTRFVASYYGQFGVRCNSICPGGLLSERLPEEFVRQYSERTCLGRTARKDDLMGAIVFLASDASEYVTGANIPVDGGYTAK